VQEALAYCLTGETFERKIYLMYGSGRNGKSTLIDLMKKVLGPFYTAISEQVFMSQKRRSGSATPELIVLQRARLGVFSEGKQDDSLDANRLKMLTGNDDISARPLYGPQFTFRPQTKYVLLTNHLPDFNVDDTAMVDRIVLIPFQHVFELKPENTAFVSSLAEAIDGLFTILARKANEVYARGSVMKPPAEAVDAFERYTSGLDTIQQFIDSACDTGEGLQCERSELFEMYILYTEQEGYSNDSKKTFYSKMTKRGYNVRRTNTGKRFFKNISLKKKYKLVTFFSKIKRLNVNVRVSSNM